jgi:hypothetical protein
LHAEFPLLDFRIFEKTIEFQQKNFHSKKRSSAKKKFYRKKEVPQRETLLRNLIGLEPLELLFYLETV